MNNAKQNYLNYLAGKEPLKHANLYMGDSEMPIHDLMAKNMNRRFWVIPFEEFKKNARKNKKK